MRILQWSLWAIGLGLQYMVLAALLRGTNREFRAVFVYVFVLFVSTITDIIAFYTISRVSPIFPYYYWTAELMRQTSLYGLVVSLVIVVLPASWKSHRSTLAVIGFAVFLWLANMAFTWGQGLNPSMTAFVRNLSFVTAVCDLGVWFTLIASGARDTRRLLIAGGLGLQMTGEAIGQSIRYLFPKEWNPALAGSLFVMLAHFICLAIWWYAFARVPAPRAAKSTHGQA